MGISAKCARKLVISCELIHKRTFFLFHYGQIIKLYDIDLCSRKMSSEEKIKNKREKLFYFHK